MLVARRNVRRSARRRDGIARFDGTESHALCTDEHQCDRQCAGEFALQNHSADIITAYPSACGLCVAEMELIGGEFREESISCGSGGPERTRISDLLRVKQAL